MDIANLSETVSDTIKECHVCFYFVSVLFLMQLICQMSQLFGQPQAMSTTIQGQTLEQPQGDDKVEP